MSPEAKLDAILAELSGAMGKLDDLSARLLSIEEAIQAEFLDAIECEGNA